MLVSYCREMGEAVPKETVVKTRGNLSVITQKNIEISASIGHYGGYYVRTKIELNGRGIRKSGDESYHLTDLAFDNLCKKYMIKMERFLD